MDKTKLILLIVCILLGQSISAFDNDCNAPRIGDRLTFHRLGGEPAWTDSARLCPDLSSVETEKSIRMQIFAAMPDDTLSTMTITFATTVMSVGERDGVICHIADFIPGETRKYKSDYPLNFNLKTGSQYIVSSDGLINEVDNFTTSGSISGNTLYGLTLAIDEERTISNVRCIESIATDTFTFGRIEPFLHTRSISEWYAPGYRYPLLRKQKDVIVALSGEEIDSATSWYMTQPDEQEDKLKDDSVNELLRNALRESERNNFTPKGTVNNQDEGIPGSKIRQTEDGITVSTAMGNGNITQLLLCDISGKVYSYQSFEDGMAEVSVSTTGLLPGLYILHLLSGDDTITYKFTI